MVARGFSNPDNISSMGRNLFCHTLSAVWSLFNIKARFYKTLMQLHYLNCFPAVCSFNNLPNVLI